jgi:hypothetical protein
MSKLFYRQYIALSAKTLDTPCLQTKIYQFSYVATYSTKKPSIWQRLMGNKEEVETVHVWFPAFTQSAPVTRLFGQERKFREIVDKLYLNASKTDYTISGPDACTEDQLTLENFTVSYHKQEI